MAVQTTYAQNTTTTPILGATGGDTYFPTGGGWFNTKGAYSVTLATMRTGQLGTTATLLATVERLFEPNNTFYPLLDLAGNPVTNLVIATGATDAAPRLLILTYEFPQGGTTGFLTFGNHKQYQIWLPEKIRFKLTHGGTGNPQNIYMAQVDIHTRM